jgi:ribosome-binding protein aMBF1 (putative translation factor)
MKPITRCVEDSGISVAQLAQKTKLNAKLIQAIVTGNYTASPSQRQLLADALGLSPEDIGWEHAVPVEHIRGNGPQSGRST